MSSEKVFKTVMVGGAGSGKTSLRNYFLHNSYSWRHNPTANPDFISTYVTLDKGEMIAMQIWDTSGSTESLPATNSLLEDADGVFLVFSSNKEASLQALEKHLLALKAINKTRPKGSSPMPVVLVQTKTDLLKPPVQDEECLAKQAKDMCRSILGSNMDITLVETSARTGKDVTLAFRTLANICHARWSKMNVPVDAFLLDLKRRRAKERMSRHGDPIDMHYQFDLEDSSTFSMKQGYSIREPGFQNRFRKFIRRLTCMP
ncbi:P-loop containing nucleoside triphosphate hydrolase protein [Kickxella alabastrina]|uniref:P-loop containing nucleoside triphosphate hydrolase protein n=1 Tax=Kickxella alabastrina TaxID=61397 RepID=UPI00221E5CF1|nr:P-loop containing nucleoside triphosphate hydrolase protein [Kickxella alabastrina]KAI7829109.1 P-loop containing nucleoside triphosphate hydrolase protein [Kickxella alabastrina]